MAVTTRNSRNSVNTSSESSSRPSPSLPSLSCTRVKMRSTSSEENESPIRFTCLSIISTSLMFMVALFLALASESSAPANFKKILRRLSRCRSNTSRSSFSPNLVRNSSASLLPALGSRHSVSSFSSLPVRVGSPFSLAYLALAMRKRHSTYSAGRSSKSGLSSSSSVPMDIFWYPSSPNSRFASWKNMSNCAPLSFLSANLHSLIIFQNSWLLMAPPAA
mmetsp:Transcript_28511/g.90869  ORF Transcript_28511/g.90869 Transcript_28511/m.90869 type:complete len:220 (+) Transcript_28511:177-836(+)